jgi:DNA-binding NtrC family response regulator
MAEILIVDDQDRYLELCQRAMPEHRYRGPARNWADTAEQLRRSRGRIDLVLLDVHFDIPPEQLLGHRAGMSTGEVEVLKRRQGLEILTSLRSRYPDLPVILMTSREELEFEEQGEEVQAEEYTYFLDDEYVDARALKSQVEAVVQASRGHEYDGPVFWGRSMAMRRIRQRLSVLAKGRLPVVLLGPTGTGKSLIARHFVHARSQRGGRFVAVDLSTVPRELMGAHLFGSVKGAYTGSVADRKGAFEEANGGTLFLDEVGNLSAEGQKLLLTVLQEGVVTRLGDLKERTVDVKLVVATNERLSQRVQEGTFRADLYMRLNPATAVTLPGLTQRSLEMDRLLGFCMEQALSRPYLADLLDVYRRTLGLSRGSVVVHCAAAVPPRDAGVLHFLFPERCMRLLRAHSWPGNLRELTDVPGDRTDVVKVRPKLIRDLLQHAPSESDDVPSGTGTSIRIELSPQDTLNKVSQLCERQYFTKLYIQHHGDFAVMADVLLGDAGEGRKVQLRFNQLGLKVRDLKGRVR